MRQAKRAVVFAGIMLSALTAGCGDSPVMSARAEAGGPAHSFSRPSVTISGPAFLYTGYTSTWQANASGGNGTYTYQWEERDAGGWYWTPVGTGSSYSRYVGLFQGSFDLRVTVTSAGVSASAEYPVYVETCDPWCP